MAEFVPLCGPEESVNQTSAAVPLSKVTQFAGTDGGTVGDSNP
jgi:hypothetical protein